MIPETIGKVTTAWLGEVLVADIRQLTPCQMGEGVGCVGERYLAMKCGRLGQMTGQYNE